MSVNRQQTSSFTSKIIKEIEALPDYNRRSFTREEDEILKKYYPFKGSKLSIMLNKPARSVVARANYLGLKCEGN